MSQQDEPPVTIEQQTAARDTMACRRCRVPAGADCHDSDGVSLADPPGSDNPRGELLVHPARVHDYIETHGGGQ